MKLRIAAFAATVAFAALFVWAYVATSVPVDVTRRQVEELQRRADGLEDVIRAVPVAVGREPTGDVSQGTFMARIDRIDAVARSPIAVIDIITDKMVPWAKEEDRRRSSWPDYFGWNKTKHPQSIRIDRDATLLVNTYGTLVDVSTSELAARWKSDPQLRHANYYVQIGPGSDGAAQVSVAWPWTY